MDLGHVVFSVVMTPRHRAALRRMAKARGETMAATLRTLIRETAEQQGLWPAHLGEKEEEFMANRTKEVEDA